MTLAGALGWLTAILAYGHATMAAVAVSLMAYYRWRDARAAGPHDVPITVLKALEGADSGLERNLRSLFDDPWPAPRQILLCVPSLADPAARLAQALIDGLPKNHDVKIVPSEGGIRCKNRKIQHLLAGLPHARHDVFVFADADIFTEAETLPALVGRLMSGPEVGIVYGASAYANEGGPGNRILSTLFGRGFHAFRTLDALSRFTRGTPAMVGALWAVRRGDLARMGGLAIVGDQIGDDLGLAEAAERAGLQVIASRVPARCFEPRVRIGEVAERLTRWIRVLAAHQPHKRLGYPLLLAHLPVLLALGALSWGLGVMWPLPLVGLALMGRYLMALYVGRRHGLGFAPGILLQLIVAEAFLFGIFIRALGGREVLWRGRRYLLEPGGMISEVKG